MRKKEEQSIVKYISNYSGKTIWFDKRRKEFGSLSGININELQAINKKCEELNFKIF